MDHQTMTFDPRRTSLNSSSLPGPSSSKKKRPSQASSRPLGDSPPPGDIGSDLAKVRAYAACKACRVKKVKCLPGPSTLRAGPTAPGDPPGPCQQCIQARTECTYPPTRDRAAYSRQYVQNLENRVQALEVMNARVMPMLETFERGRGMGGIQIRPDQRQIMDGYQKEENELQSPPRQIRVIPPPPPVPDELADEQNQEELDEEAMSNAEDFGEDNGQMTQDEHGNYRWIGSSNTLSLLDSFTPTTPHVNPTPKPGQESRPGENPYFAPVAGSGVVKILPSVDEVMYPEPKAAREMIDAYFREIHPVLPIMIESEFREQYAAIMDRRARGVMEPSGIFICLVFAMFALGERVLVTSRAWRREKRKMDPTTSPTTSTSGQRKEDDSEETVLPGEAEAGVIWYERAQILRYTTITDISLHQVQGLILMAAFQASVNAMPMSWLLCGVALRMAQDLGLHRSAARHKISPAEKQVRSRCWWGAYGLDRMLSLTLGRPPGVDDLDIDVPYPSEVDDETLISMAPAEGGSSNSPLPAESASGTMSGFVSLTKLCKISGKISHILYRPSHGRSVHDPAWLTSQQTSIDKLDKALRDWLANDVAPKYKDPSQDPGVQIVSAALSNTYFACLITLHRNFLPPSADSSRPRPLPSSTSLSHCVAAARSVIHIAAQSRILVPPSHHLAVFCQYLWSAAVMLLLCEVQAKDQVVVDAVGPQVDSCRRSLRALEPVWPGAKKLKELLDEAERRGKEVLASGRANENGKRRASFQGGSGSGKRPGLNPASGKKRTSSSNTSTFSPQPLRQTSTEASSRGIPPSHRSAMGARPSSSQAYETSDTRTPVQDRSGRMSQSSTSSSSGLLPQHPHQAYSGGGQGPTIRPVDLLQPINYTFDVGGVDFDGLEMLQGFNNDFASLWQTMISDGGAGIGSTNGSMLPPQQGYMMGAGGGGGEPTLGGIGGPVVPTPGTSPQANTGPAWLQSPQTSTTGEYDLAAGSGGGTAGYGVLSDLGTSEFWSQIAAAGQDWGADPNVPFQF